MMMASLPDLGGRTTIKDNLWHADMNDSSVSHRFYLDVSSRIDERIITEKSM